MIDSSNIYALGLKLCHIFILFNLIEEQPPTFALLAFGSLYILYCFIKRETLRNYLFV